MTFTRIHHIGLVTSDLERARTVLGKGFGLSVDEHRTPGSLGRQRPDGAAVLEFPIGEMYYEVICPAAGDSASDPARFLAESSGRGGVQFMALASDDLGGDLAVLGQRGVTMPRLDQASGAYVLDPDSCLGLDIRVVPEDHYYVHPAFRGNGVSTGMAHIGIAARSARAVRRLLTGMFGLREDEGSVARLALDSEPEPRTEAHGQSMDPVHLLEFPIGGSVIEISVPTSTDSGTAKLVAQRAPLGAIYHHTCPHTPDVYRFIDQAVAAGLQQIGALPPPGTTALQVGWLHPRSCLGMLVEVWNRPPGIGHYRPPTVP